MRSPNRLFLILAILFAGLLVLRVSQPKKGFRSERVTSPLPKEKAWECSTSKDPVVDRLLRQKFHYIGSGAQMYVFLGEDDKTILKLFKMERLLPKKWLQFLSFPAFMSEYKERKTSRREQRRAATFASCKLAFDHFKDETGLIHVQLNPKRNDPRILHVIDKQHESHYIPLKDTPYILQKKAELIYSRFQRRLKQGDLKKLQEEQHAVLQLIDRRTQKGIADDDSGVSQNFGFVGDQPVQIDFGELYHKEFDANDSEHSRDHVDAKMTKWIQANVQ